MILRRARMRSGVGPIILCRVVESARDRAVDPRELARAVYTEGRYTVDFRRHIVIMQSCLVSSEVRPDDRPGSRRGGSLYPKLPWNEFVVEPRTGSIRGPPLRKLL